VVSLVSSERRASRLATFGAAANIAISLAPALVVVVLGSAPLEVGLLLTAAFATAAGVLAARLPTSHEPSHDPSDERAGFGVWDRRWNGVATLVPPRRVWLPMCITALLGAGFAAFFPFAPILADRREVFAGWLYTAYGLAIIATRLFGGRLLDRFDVGRVVLPSAALMVLAYALLATSDMVPLLVLGVGGIAVSSGLFHPALLAHHARLLPDTPGRASAAFYSAFDLGIGLGSWLFGFVLQFGGVADLYWAAAAVAAGALPLAPRLARTT
jgi:predicted MFS family arabinose efflux permease